MNSKSIKKTNFLIIGEASTTYFYDRVPYWYNKSNEIEFDDSLPPLPELVTNELPDIKIIISLRDPVDRAISAYYHWMKTGITSPRLGLKKVAKEYPKMRILEYGYYEEYLKIWQKYVPQERILILIF
ncbi:putative sulfotransferase domain protein [Desulfosarcina variabilis str. Montpellier]|uniref:sulfotransferase domain-containing protein n=1 Tax=Desulfosarcina variabilis TaxID=2300 RepID=UPI003AFA1F4F